MTKKSRLTSKKRTIITLGSVLIVLIAGAAVAYHFYTQNQKQQTEKTVEQKKVVDIERKKLDDTAFRGDRDVAAQYVAKIQDGQLDDAYDLYVSAAQKVADNTAKIALYEQAVAIASQAKQSDHAIKYAVALSDLANNYRASANVAYLYGVDKDYTNQKKYLQQAINQIEKLPQGSDEYRDMKAYYQTELSKVGGN